MFVYDAEKRLVAFTSGHVPERKGKEGAATAETREDVVVFVGGLTDGFLATPYLPELGDALARCGWELVQALLSSSYSGYGHASLAQDVQELDRLLHHMVRTTVPVCVCGRIVAELGHWRAADDEGTRGPGGAPGTQARTTLDLVKYA